MLGCEVVEAAVHPLPEIVEVVGGVGALAADELLPGRVVQFDSGHAGAVLSAVAHFPHQQLQALEAVQGGTVGFVVVAEWFLEADHRQSALVVDRFTHTGHPVWGGAKVRRFCGGARVQGYLLDADTPDALRLHTGPDEVRATAVPECCCCPVMLPSAIAEERKGAATRKVVFGSFRASCSIG